MQGKPAPDQAKRPALLAHVALLRLQRDTLQSVIEVLERELDQPPAPVEAQAPAPRPRLTYRQVLDLPHAA